MGSWRVAGGCSGAGLCIWGRVAGRVGVVWVMVGWRAAGILGGGRLL